MLKELKKLIYLISILGSISNCYSKKSILVIKVEDVKDNSKLYSPNCYINNNNKEMLIREGFLYINNSLKKYITPQVEGFVVENVDESGYTKETEKFKNLEFKQNKNNTVSLFEEEYKIININRDTLFLENNLIIINNPNIVDF